MNELSFAFREGYVNKRQEPTGEFHKGLTRKVQEGGVVTLAILVGAALTYTLAQVILPLLHVANPDLDSYLLGLSANLLVAVILYYFLERGIRSINDITIMPNLDFKGVIKAIDSSSHSVRILETWTRLVNSDVFYNPFVAAVEHAARQGSTVYILLLHPDSEGAHQRARQLAGTVDVRAEIHKSLARLYTLQTDGAFRDLQDHVQVRIYNALPPAIVYACDSRGYASLFPVDRMASERPNLELNMASRLGGIIDEKFRELWQGSEHAQPIALHEHMMLRVLEPQPAHEFYYAPATYRPGWFISSDDADAVVRMSKHEQVSVALDGKALSARPALVEDPQDRLRALETLARRYDWTSKEQVMAKLQKGPVVARLSLVDAPGRDAQDASDIR